VRDHPPGPGPQVDPGCLAGAASAAAGVDAAAAAAFTAAGVVVFAAARRLLLAARRSPPPQPQPRLLIRRNLCLLPCLAQASIYVYDSNSGDPLYQWTNLAPKPLANAVLSSQHGMLVTCCLENSVMVSSAQATGRDGAIDCLPAFACLLSTPGIGPLPWHASCCCQTCVQAHKLQPGGEVVPQRAFGIFASGVKCLALAPDGDTLLTGTMDGTLVSQHPGCLDGTAGSCLAPWMAQRDVRTANAMRWVWCSDHFSPLNTGSSATLSPSASSPALPFLTRRWLGRWQHSRRATL